MRFHNLYRFLLLALLLAQGMLLQAQVQALQTSSAPSGGKLLDVWFLDVAQGNCVLIKLPSGKFMLYDAGSTSSSVDPDTIAKQITTLTGGADITTIFLSHPDADHINIIPYIKEAKKPMYVHFSGAVSDYDDILEDWIDSLPTTTTKVTYKSYFSDTDPLLNVDDDKETMIYMMAANVPGDANTKSLVVSIDYDDTNVLLSGDATATTERWILKNWTIPALKTTVYSFAHHGSNHSNNKLFLKTIKPNIGIFSASAQHKGYGHPRCVIIDYVETLVDENGKNGMTVANHRVDCWDGSQYVVEENDLGVFLTATQGWIHFQSDGKNYKVEVKQLK